MESNFSNRDFERFVQRNADQYRMFPSEKVWNHVHRTLHKRRRWYGLGLAFLLLLTGAAVTMVMRSYPVLKKQGFAVADNPVEQASTPNQPGKTLEDRPTDLRDLIPFEDADEVPVAKLREQLQPLPAIGLSGPAPNNADNDNTGSNNAAMDLWKENSKPSPALSVVNRPEPSLSATPGLLVNMHDYPRQAEASGHSQVDTPGEQPSTTQNTPTELAWNQAPYTIESVLNSFKPAPKRVSWQLFFTPTISYRALRANSDFASSPGGPLPFPFASLEDVNKAVTHKPDLGFQLGLMGRYPLSKRVNLRAGFQLNVNKYDIKAFSYPGEVAVINLDDPNSTTVATWTRYRSQSGYKSNWLKNYYLSVSVPIGAEVTLFGNKHTSVGIAGTIQPTYVVRDRAYLISTDYKNYAKVPWLVRRVNMSTGFEAFVNYGKGKTRWQVGPQVRYQLLSSFHNKYPVKEYLFDFGLKLGITLNP